MTKLTVLPLEMIQTLQVFSVGRRPKKGLQPGTVETERQRWEGEKKRRETERA